MAEYTVFDIKGKGFKYEQYAQEQENAPPPSGTFGCFIGTSNWGPINKPYIVTNGSLEFKNIFGFAGTRIDHGWEAANLHFNAPSALGIYTRLADENFATRSSFILKDKMDKPAIVIGENDIRNGVIIDSTNKILKMYVQYKEENDIASKEIDPLTIDFSTNLSTKASTSGVVSSSFPFTIGTNSQTIIKINNGTEKYIFTIKPTSTQTISNITDFYNFLIDSSFTSVINEDGNAIVPKPLITDYLNITTQATNTIVIQAKSINYNFRVTDDNKVFKDINIYPIKTPYVSILQVINNAFNAAVDENNNAVTNVASYGFASLNERGNLVLTGINSGINSKIKIDATSTILDSLGLKSGNGSEGDKAGSLGTQIGTFRAKYRGVEGNTIQLRFYEDNGLKNLGIIFRGNLISNIVDYNFDVTSEYFLGNLIDNDVAAKDVLKYDHAVKFFEFNDEDESLSDGITIYRNDGITPIGSGWSIERGVYNLAGGNSGENGNELNYNILTIIEELKNLDLYQIDFIAAPGYEEENVQNALLSLCAYRQDCFAFLDMPLITGTNKRDAVNKAVKYVNGSYLRSEKIDSIYGFLAFPYVRYRKKYYNSANQLVSEMALISPTTIVPYLYSLRDITSKTTFDMAAGEGYGGRILLSPNNFTGTQFILSQEDRDILYADSLDACINPISYNTEAGFFLDGQKTTLRKNLNGKLTSLSRVSVMRSGLFIKKTSYKISRQYFFAPIDPQTWKDFSARLSREIMQPLVTNRMIEPNYIVKCDEITNTPQVRNANGMVAYIEFTPYKKLERIKVIANITETDSNVSIE